MNGIISGIKRMEIHDGDGLRTTVFFKGCPLRCLWCHNPESISFEHEIAFFKSKCIGCGMCKGERNEKTEKLCPTEAIYSYGREYTVPELLEVILEDEPFFKNGGGVTLSGGECLAQRDFAVAIAKSLKERGISVYVDTSGYVKQDALKKIAPYTDKFLYDIKAMDEDVHIHLTGKSNRLILDNLRYLIDIGCNVEIRYPLVMGYNDLECEKIARLLTNIGGISNVKVLKYHPFAASRYEALGMKYMMRDVETTTKDVLLAVNIFRKYGLPSSDEPN